MTTLPTPGPTTVVEADPTKPYKAYAATALAFAAAFVAWWVGDEDPFTKKDAGVAFLFALGSSGLTGVTTWTVRNPVRVRR